MLELLILLFLCFKESELLQIPLEKHNQKKKIKPNFTKSQISLFFNFLLYPFQGEKYMQEKKKFYTCKYDRAFKEVFMKEDNKDILTNLLEEILEVKINNLQFFSTHN